MNFKMCMKSKFALRQQRYGNLLNEKKVKKTYVFEALIFWKRLKDIFSITFSNKN